MLPAECQIARNATDWKRFSLPFSNQKNIFLKKFFVLLHTKGIINYLNGRILIIASVLPSSLHTSSRRSAPIARVFFGLCFALVVVLGFSLSVSADTVSYESALIWRADGTGDFTLPGVSADGVTVEPEGIMTRGIVTQVTAVWEFSGVVTLEVSADGGLNYVSVVCGTPVVDGLMQGQKLRWRATLGEDGVLDEVRLTYRDSSGVVGSFGNPQLTGFRFRRPLRVSAMGGPQLFNTQVRVKIGEGVASQGAVVHCAGHAKADFSDVRFTLADGVTALPHTLERVTGAPPGRVAEFYVKVPQVPEEGALIFIYYGNPEAQDTSDPDATFDFYEDFATDELSADKWLALFSPNGKAELVEGGISLDAAAIYSKEFALKDGIIEYAATALTGFEVRCVFRDAEPMVETDASYTAYASAIPDAQHCIAAGNIVVANDPVPIVAGARYEYKVRINNKDITFERYDSDLTQRQAVITHKDKSKTNKAPRQGYLGLKTSGTGVGQSDTQYHYIRVRKYVDPEPQMIDAGIAGEETVNLPYFQGTVIGPNGDLERAEGALEGLFVTREIIAPYDVRILVPSWRGRGVTVDISADGGKTYKLSCDNGAYYYASKRDFSPGRKLRTRANLTSKEVSSISRLELLALQYAIGNVILLSPNGGEQFSIGSQQEVRWSAWDYEVTYPILIEYSIDGGKTFRRIDATQNTGRYIWSIPKDTELITEEAMIKVSDSLEPTIADTSDRPFSITAGALDITEEEPAPEETTEEEPVTEETVEEAAAAEEAAAEEAAAAEEVIVIEEPEPVAAEEISMDVSDRL